MALPSQTSSGAPGGRSKLGRSGRRRGGGRRKFALIALAVAGGGAGLWLVLRSGPADARAEADPTTLAMNGPQPEARPPQPAPVELTQRRGSAAPAEPDAPSRAEEDLAPPEPAPAPARIERPAPAAPTAPTLSAGAAVRATIQAGEEKLRANDPIAARRILNDALHHRDATEADRATIRSMIAQINEDLVFSPRMLRDDPLVETYTIEPGDSLAKITNGLGLAVDYRFLARVNRLSSPDRISVGQTLKLVRGPFHAVVSKSAFRMDLYHGPGEHPEQWLYITSRPVGLGESGTTPTGVFVVRRESKLVNPYWTNPRTGEQFDADNPQNPIGERWIGLRGLGDAAAFAGYGVHGTIDPGSIGGERSMGCVRMLPEDVALVYEMLAEEVSYVHIVP